MKSLLLVCSILLAIHVDTAAAFQQSSKYYLYYTPATTTTTTSTTSTSTSTTQLYMDDSPTLDIPYGETSRQYRRTVYTHDDW